MTTQEALRAIAVATAAIELASTRHPEMQLRDAAPALIMILINALTVCDEQTLISRAAHKLLEVDAVKAELPPWE